jgi:glucose/arabinose dehydrogenase
VVCQQPRPGSTFQLRRITTVALAFALTAAGCGQARRPPRAAPRPAGNATLHPTQVQESSAAPGPKAADKVRLALVRVASVRNAVALAVTPLDSALYIASRGGRVFRLEPEGQPEIILDLSSEVSCCEAEQGMFGLTFSPDGLEMYVSFTDDGGALHVTQFRVSEGRPVKETRLELLTVEQLSTRHHGGSVAFGPDGYLYIGLGDSSLGFDPTNEAQSLDSLRGKLLRIDPGPSGARPYGVPASNPFVNRPGARPEIFAYGLRNPWRFSFDRLTGDLWLADVGQFEVEEINFLPAGTGAGTNFGWNRLEGSRPVRGRPPKEHLLPVAEYRHTRNRCAVIGGYVYRGSRIPSLRGGYVYGDLCDGRVRVLVHRRGDVLRSRSLGVQVDALASFGQDANGELYVLTLYRGVYRLDLPQ